MSTEEGDLSAEGARVSRVSKTKPAKALPTDRVGFEKQTLILRAYAKASAAADGQAVANSDVAKYADLHVGSISVCNPFWNDIGLLVREGLKNRPDAAVMEFDQASEWNAEKAGAKLTRVLEASWFGQALVRKLALRPAMPKAEAIEFLAEEARAATEYRNSLEMLLEYLKLAGVIVYDGVQVSRPARVDESDQVRDTGGNPDRNGVNGGRRDEGSAVPPAPVTTQRFSIPLPGKASVVIEMPKDIDKDDWIMLSSMLAQYIKRWKKFATPKELTDQTDEDDLA